MKKRLFIMVVLLSALTSNINASESNESNATGNVLSLCKLHTAEHQQDINTTSLDNIIYSKIDGAKEFVKHITIKKRSKIRLKATSKSKTVFLTYRYPIAAKAYSYQNGFYQTGMGWIHHSRVIVPINQ